MTLKSDRFFNVLELAMLHYRNGAYQESLGLIEEVRDLGKLDHALAHLGGLSAFRLGQLELAKTYILKAVELSPDDAASWNVLGEIHRLSKDLLEAVKALQKAIALNPDLADAFSNLGNVYSDADDYDNAVAAYSKALAITPSHIDARYNLGNIAFRCNRYTLALDSYQQVLTHAPSHTGALNNYGLLLLSLRQYEEASQIFKRALSIEPTMTAAIANYATALIKSNNTPEALSVIDEHLAKVSTVDSLPLLLLKAQTLKDHGNREEAKRAFQAALVIAPSNEEAQAGLINVEIELGNSFSARERLSRLLESSPDNLGSLFPRCMIELPAAYRSEQEILETRDRYETRLHDLKRRIEQLSDDSIRGIENLIGTAQPFYLAYQAMNDRALQMTYGEMIATAMQRAVKIPALPAPNPVSDRRVKVGIVSGFFRNHSNYKIPIRGWLQNIDKKKFQLFGYHTQQRIDEHTREAESLCDTFVQGPKTLAEWISAITADSPDILIFPEIGMDPMTCRLASLRLAPHQATSWGHPETSGLPTIDYFISSALMEPEGSEAYYSEKLIRLPQLSFYYQPPIRKKLHMSRKEVGLKDDSFVFWCCQTNYKYLPQFDWVFPAIAQEVPNAEFLFIQIQPNSESSAILRERLTKAFAERGLDATTFVRYIHGLDADQFASVASLCDLALDSFEWSGCNSALETLAQGVPVLTYPGTFMRSRHTSAILKTMQCEELIASSPQEFVKHAVSLAQTPELFQSLKAKVVANVSLPYRDPTCVRALEDTLIAWASAHHDA
jgi:protein O-GlcNAc transferase